MSITTKKLRLMLLLCLLLIGIGFLFPYLFKQVVVWQREFNQLLSDNLHQIKQAPIYAGLSLILISFGYGVFHALGPGHGKFIITSYLSIHQSKIFASMRLAFLSSLMQGVVAIVATSIVVVILNLSSAYFKASQLWLERGAYALIFLLGLQWLMQSGRKIWQAQRKPKILQIKPIADNLHLKSAVQNPIVFLSHIHDENCGCGHQHLPDADQVTQANNLKSQWLIILSIGMRPCTGAIFILFLSYMLDLYIWGMVATMAMAIGTGITLSGFALMVQYARTTAVKVGKWYLSPTLKNQFSDWLKLVFGLILIGFAVSLIYATTLQSVGGAVLFGR
ncbi:zinc transporter permease subunit ZevB [Lonepinella sp. MS14436]|uniref:zinc transporter permease subunit ZevB n=1 Tax=Lonepinella sp. MS14436 TaxID=3003619 RepID=UPI0036DE91E7